LSSSCRPSSPRRLLMHATAIGTEACGTDSNRLSWAGLGEGKWRRLQLPRGALRLRGVATQAISQFDPLLSSIGLNGGLESGRINLGNLSIMDARWQASWQKGGVENVGRLRPSLPRKTISIGSDHPTSARPQLTTILAKKCIGLKIPAQAFCALYPTIALQRGSHPRLLDTPWAGGSRLVPRARAP